MTRSMTGYGRATRIESGYSVTVELKSVNHRYLDCTVRMPRSYIYMEDSIKKTIAERVSRGKVDVYLTVESEDGADVTVVFSEKVAEAYINALSQLKEKFSLNGNADLMAIARMPEVLTVEKRDPDEKLLSGIVLSTLSEALDSFMSMCYREGESMKKDILDRADRILEAVGRIELRSAEVTKGYRERLLARLNEVLADTNIDESRILTEAAIFADKVAVDEETVRLRSHVAQLRELLEGKEASGRKLDFLVQEFNREANTIGSKVNDLTLTKEVVGLKAEIEKIREQIQNIE